MRRWSRLIYLTYFPYVFRNYVIMGENAFRPLFLAVAQSTRLRELDCTGCATDLGFIRDMVLPAIRSNTSLRRFSITDDNLQELSDEDEEEVQVLLGELEELESLVAAW